jgi:hypothetical protein
MNRFLAFLASALALWLTPMAWGQSTVSLPGRSINKLLPDYLRPRVYALNQANGSVSGTLLAFDSANGTILDELTLSLNPTDMAVTPASDALYVIHAGSRTISKVDLTTFTVVGEKAISTPNTYSPSNPLYLVANNSGTIYFTDGAWGPEVYSFDYASGIQTLLLDTGGNQSSGAGGLVLSKDSGTLYTWLQYGWSAGLISSAVVSYSISSNSLTTLTTGPTQGRDPLDTPIFLDGGQRWVFNKAQKVASTNTSVLLTQFSDNVYGISLDGSIAFGPSEVFNSLNGIILTNFSFATTVQTLSGDQKKLFRYNPATTNVVIYDMTVIAPVTGTNLLPSPSDGAVVTLPLTNLAWSVSPFALAYEVYFGTNRDDISTATPTSAQFLGRVFGPSQALARDLFPAITYYWRVDVVSFNATNAGPVWSFVVSPLSVNPTQLTLGSIAGYSPKAVSMSLTSASPLKWTAMVAGTNWLTLSSNSGTSPSTLTVSLNTAAFQPGLYTNRIDIVSAGMTIQIPVSLDIKPLNIVKMVADYERPYIYAIQAPPLTGQNGQVLFINTATEMIEKTLPIGFNPVDLTVHYGEGRLYIASWTENATYVVDLTTQTLLPPLDLGTDIFKISAGKPGQLMVEGEDQWVGIALINTTDGSVLVSGTVREGDGKFDPSGRYYYHGDNNISGAGIAKWDMSTNTFAAVAGAAGHYYFGSRNVIMSPDGSRIFWTGAAYDAALNDLGYFGEEIYATTAHGDLAMGSQHVFNSHNGQSLYTWAFSTTVLAVSGDQQKVFLFNSAAKQLVTIPMSSIAAVPGPGLNPTPADGSVINPPLTRVSWTLSPLAISYQVFMGTNRADVTSADTNSLLFLGTTSSNVFPLPNLVSPGLTYYWRVDTVGFSAIARGPVWSYTAFGLSASPQSLSLKGVAGLPILPQTISLDASLPTSWTLAISQPWLWSSATNGTTPSMLTLSFNTTNLLSGYYTNQLTFSANGVSLQMPLVVQLIVLKASKMVADRNRNAIYVLHPGSGNFDDAFLIFLNADSGGVENVVPIGTNPTDLSINAFEDRLYVSNWQHNQTRVIDLVTRTELTPLSLGTDIYKLNAGKAGQLMIEGEDQWVGVALINTTDGSVLVSGTVREGDGKFDPSGRYYYHGDNNISGAGITKFDMSTNTFTAVVGAAGHYYFGSRNIVMSLDGSRLFWTSGIYDASLVDLGVIGDEIYSCSTNGAVAFGAAQAYDTATKRSIYPLPASTSVSVVDRNNQRFWCFDSATASLRSIPMLVVQSPQITQQPVASTSVVLGTPLYLTVAAQGMAPLAYQWIQAGTNLPGQTNYFLSVPNAQRAQQGDYQVIVSNPFSSVTSSVAHVTILTAPAIVTQSADTNVLAGQAFTLSVTVAGTPPFTYSWLFGSVSIGDASASTLTLTDAQAINQGGYRAVVANAYGSVTGAVISVDVLPSGPNIVTDPFSQSVFASSNATFSVGARGSEPLSYQWLFNGSPIPGAKAAQFTMTNVQSGNAGAYQAVATNSFGSVTSIVATLNVLPRAPYFITQPQDVAVNAGSNFTLIGLANGSQPIAYQWQRNGGKIAGAVLPSLVLTNPAVADSGRYALVASNIAGVSTSAVAQVTVYQIPTVVQALSNQVVDVQSTVTLSVSAQGNPAPNYTWQRNGQPVAGTGSILIVTNIGLSQAGFYSVTVTNQYGSASSRARVSVLAAPSRVVAWGDDSGGQTNVPISASAIVEVAGGDYHSLALQHDGRLTAWGLNTYGQLDVPTNALRFVAAAAGADHNLAITEAGSLVAWGRNDAGQSSVPVSTSNNVLSVAAGDSHSLALLASGTVVAWGDNAFGQTSVPPSVSVVRAIAAGRNHSLALRVDGVVVGWGDNSYGHATPPLLTNAVGIAAGFLHSAAVLANGTVVVWGDNTFGQADVPAGLTNAVAIAAGDFHTLALRADGTVVGWGDNHYSQSSVPAGLLNVSAVACGTFHNLVLTTVQSTLQIARDAPGLVLRWTSGGTLQSAPTPLGPFTDIMIQGNAFTNSDLSAPAKFFRIWPGPVSAH